MVQLITSCLFLLFVCFTAFADWNCTGTTVTIDGKDDQDGFYPDKKNTNYPAGTNCTIIMNVPANSYVSIDVIANFSVGDVLSVTDEFGVNQNFTTSKKYSWFSGGKQTIKLNSISTGNVRIEYIFVKVKTAAVSYFLKDNQNGVILNNIRVSSTHVFTSQSQVALFPPIEATSTLPYDISSTGVLLYSGNPSKTLTFLGTYYTLAMKQPYQAPTITVVGANGNGHALLAKTSNDINKFSSFKFRYQNRNSIINVNLTPKLNQPAALILGADGYDQNGVVNAAQMGGQLSWYPGSQTSSNLISTYTNGNNSLINQPIIGPANTFVATGGSATLSFDVSGTTLYIQYNNYPTLFFTTTYYSIPNAYQTTSYNYKRYDYSSVTLINMNSYSDVSVISYSIDQPSTTLASGASLNLNTSSFTLRYNGGNAADTGALVKIIFSPVPTTTTTTTTPKPKGGTGILSIVLLLVSIVIAYYL